MLEIGGIVARSFDQYKINFLYFISSLPSYTGYFLKMNNVDRAGWYFHHHSKNIDWYPITLSIADRKVETTTRVIADISYTVTVYLTR